MKDEKYVVLSRAKMEGSTARLIDQPNTELFVLTDWIVPDAVVIRLQDVFAPPALYAYANSISVAVEVLEREERIDPFSPRGVRLFEQIANLKQIADYFAQAAEESAHVDRKLPD